MTQSAVPDHREAGQASLLTRRFATMGEHSLLFYDTPIEFESGSGVWLFDVKGRRYLDAYNNVPHVGHCHPRVVSAIANQAARLNIHTRYLNAAIVDYAEKLLATFSVGLDRVAFTNSGSESNELALRVARQHTGNAGILVSDFSYHGNTHVLAELTTALKVREPLGHHVRTFRVPDLDQAGPENATLEQALTDLDAAIDDLQRTGHGVGAVLFDPLFSTEGLPRVPEGFVEALCTRVHDAGGLVIADEVQSGFGRSGLAWGHELYDVRPDLVTLGKPMGNGHPLGAVVMGADLLAEFGSHNLYFNTFAGNPVSAAAGRAVLEVMIEEDLTARARDVGSVACDSLNELNKEFLCINAVKGQGLFLGLEIIDRSGKPDGDFTRGIVDRMRQLGVLISRVGRHDNVLKIRPPLVFDTTHVEVLTTQLSRALSDE